MEKESSPELQLVPDAAPFAPLLIQTVAGVPRGKLGRDFCIAFRHAIAQHPRELSSSPHPIFVLAVLGLLATVIMLITAFKVRSRGLKVLLGLIGLATLAPAGMVLVAMHPEWVDARLRSYQAFYAGIRPGMTRAEVMALQAQLYPEKGPRRKPRIIVDEAESLTFFMDPEDPASSVDCEAILLKLKEGKVTAKTYSPD